jgi:hypothetical protein
MQKYILRIKNTEIQNQYNMFELEEETPHITKNMKNEMMKDILHKLLLFNTYKLDEKQVINKSRGSSIEIVDKANIEGVDEDEEIDIGYSAIDLDYNDLEYEVNE